MGAHKGNEQAAYRYSLPNLAPLGETAGASFDVEVVPKPNVLLFAPESVRQHDGHTQVLLPESEGQWVDLPVGAELCELGQMLPVDKCDVIATLYSVRGLDKVAVGAVRIPLSKWREAHSIVKIDS